MAVSVLDADDLNPEFDQQSYPVSLSDQASNVSKSYQLVSTSTPYTRREGITHQT